MNSVSSIDLPLVADKPDESAWTKPHFGALESLRGIAAVSVVAVHVRGSAFDGTPLVPWFEAIGLFGVPVFFVISGFVLWRPHVARNVEDRPPVHAVRFIRRRAVRIFPAYFVLLAASALLLTRSSWIDLSPVQFLTLTQTFTNDARMGAGDAAIGVTWSLSIEVWFYVALTVVLFALAQRAVSVRTEAAVLCSLFFSTFMLTTTCLALARWDRSH